MLTPRQRIQIQKAIAELQKVLDAPGDSRPTQARAANGSNARRSSKDAGAFRRQIKAAYKKGAKVSDLAATHGVTSSYIYQMLRKA